MIIVIKNVELNVKLKNVLFQKKILKLSLKKKFYYDCGILLKHYPNSIKKSEIMPCPLLPIDKNFFPE